MDCGLDISRGLLQLRNNEEEEEKCAAALLTIRRCIGFATCCTCRKPSSSVSGAGRALGVTRQRATGYRRHSLHRRRLSWPSLAPTLGPVLAAKNPVGPRQGGLSAEKARPGEARVSSLLRIYPNGTLKRATCGKTSKPQLRIADKRVRWGMDNNEGQICGEEARG